MKKVSHQISPAEAALLKIKNTTNEQLVDFILQTHHKIEELNMQLKHLQNQNCLIQMHNTELNGLRKMIDVFFITKDPFLLFRNPYYFIRNNIICGGFCPSVKMSRLPVFFFVKRLKLLDSMKYATYILLDLTCKCLCLIYYVLCLLAPSYSLFTSVLPGNNGIVFVLSLFRLYSYSPCHPFKGLFPIYTSSSNGSYVNACRSFVAQINGVPLEQGTNIICGLPGNSFLFSSQLCTNLKQYNNASYILLCCLISILGIEFIGIILSLLLYSNFKTYSFLISKIQILKISIFIIYLTSSFVFVYMCSNKLSYGVESQFLSQTRSIETISLSSGHVALFVSLLFNAYSCILTYVNLQRLEKEYCNTSFLSHNSNKAVSYSVYPTRYSQTKYQSFHYPHIT